MSQYLRTDIIRGPAKSRRSLVVLQKLSHAEVSQTDIPFFVHEHIFWLQVPVDVFLAVEEGQGEEDLCGVEGGPGLVETTGMLQMGEEFAAFLELHDQEDLFRGLEGVVQVHDERVVHVVHDHLFRSDVLELPLLKDRVFVD